MKVPLSICLVLILLTIIGTWWYRTREMNFFPDVTVASQIDRVQVTNPFVGPPELVGPPKPIALSPDEIEQFEILPAIDEYRFHADRPAYLQRLFAVLKTTESHGRTYLAGERLLELPQIQLPEKEQIVRTLSQLFSDIQPWTYDSEEQHTIKLTLSVPKSFNANGLISELEFLLTESSGGIVRPQFNTIDGTPSITLTFDHAPEPSTLTTSLTDYQSLQKTRTDLYHLIARHLNQTYAFSLPEWEEITHAQFQVCLTRYAWKRLVTP